MPDHRRVDRALRRMAASTLAVLLLISPEVAAQRADSMALAPDTTTITWTGMFADAASRQIPARTYAFELIEILRDEPASFVFDLGSYGWPHGWAPGGIAPQHLSLLWNDVPLNDLFTGRPLFELLPLNSAEPPIIEYGDASAASITLQTRRHYSKTGRPLTELGYQTGGSGLQKVSALHTQNRPVSIASRNSVLNVLFSYGGEGSDGEYPGSRVKQGRQIYSRLRFARPAWSLEISQLYNKRSTGAHGGVIPRASGDFDSIYQRLGASVIESDAVRSLKRNDFFASLRIDPGSRNRNVTALTTGFTSQRSEYRRPGDTLAVRATNVFFRLAQEMNRRSHRLVLEVTGSSTRAGPRSMALSFDETSDSRLLASGQGEARLGGLHALAKAGVELRKEGTLMVGRATLHQRVGPAALRIDVSQTAGAVRLVDRTGLGAFLQPVSDVPLGTTRMARASLSIEGGPFDLSVIGSIARESDWIDYFGSTNSDSALARTGTTPLDVVAAGLDIGFRRSAVRGFYFTAQPSVFGTSKSETAAHAQYRESLPDLYAVARLGVRYLLFRGDLDLDLAVRGRFWTEFTSRALHTQTGLLTLPAATSRPVESSATLDLIVSGGVRAATLFLAYENVLTGTTFLPGNLLVPVYPLPEKRLRFGVFWPIQN